MFDHLLESSHRDDSNKWSNIGFGEEITQIDLIDVTFTHLILGTDYIYNPIYNRVTSLYHPHLSFLIQFMETTRNIVIMISVTSDQLGKS